MESTVEALDGNKVKLSVSVDEAEFESAVDAAFRKIANEVRLPGFRPGKAPRKVLEARLGTGVARQEALRDALPGYYAEALRENEVDAIASPEIDITSGEEGGPVSFDAVVEIRPRIDLQGYGAIEITIPRPGVTDADVAERIDALRQQHADYEASERPATDGDQVLVDINGSQDGEELEGLTATDYLYEVGSGAVVPEIDENLRGAKAGDIVAFDAAHPEQEDATLQFRILVKEVRGSKLPELTDEWVAEITEHGTVAELEEAYREQLTRQRVSAANMALQQKISERLASLVTEEVPSAMVDNEVAAGVENFARRLQMQGVNLEQFLEMTGRSPEDLVNEYKEPALQSVKVDLALRAIAEAEELEATEADVEERLAALARDSGVEVDQIRENFERAGQMLAVRSEIRKGKALEWVLDRVSLTDEDGEPVERDALKLPTDGTADDPATEPEEDNE